MFHWVQEFPNFELENPEKRTKRITNFFYPPLPSIDRHITDEVRDCRRKYQRVQTGFCDPVTEVTSFIRETTLLNTIDEIGILYMSQKRVHLKPLRGRQLNPGWNCENMNNFLRLWYFASKEGYVGQIDIRVGVPGKRGKEVLESRPYDHGIRVGVKRKVSL